MINTNQIVSTVTDGQVRHLKVIGFDYENEELEVTDGEEGDASWFISPELVQMV
jgi:hypothetical protein